jgi:type II secretory pathway component PulK
MTIMIFKAQSEKIHRRTMSQVGARLGGKRASSLMLVLWAIMFMGFAVMGVVEMMQFSIEENAISAREFRALHMAECGIALGLHPQIKPGDPALIHKLGSDSSIEVKISSEGARFPINYITDTGYREAAYRLFVNWGINPDDANVAADSLSDWADSDDNPRSQGAESDYYKGLGYMDFPRNQGFSSLEEMVLVRGMDAIEKAKPDWREYFTVYGDGLIDLNNASRDLIVAVCDVAETEADGLIRERNGPDSTAGTEDDKTLSASEAQKLLGLDTQKYASLQARITTDHLTRRVESIGRVGESTYKVVVVARRQDDGSLSYIARMENQ